MVWLVGLVVFGAVATAWLTGHLFGRVVMFLLLGGVVSAVAFVSHATGIVVLLAGLPVAWAVASAPIWVARRRLRNSDASFVVPYPR